MPTSTILKLHGERMIDGACEPGFRVRLYRKDMSLAAARALGLALPNSAIVEQLIDAAVGHGDGD